jgi:adhesin isopeptide-forming family sspB-C2 type protein
MEQPMNEQAPADMEPSGSYPRPAHAEKRSARQRKKRLLMLAGAAGLVLLVLAAALWFFMLRGKKTTPPVAQNTNTSTQQQTQTPSTPTDSTPETFKSAKLNIELTHRKDWTLKEATTGELTLTSPRISYTRVDGSAGTGVFTMKIRKGVSEAMKATIDKAVAVRDSKVIGYTAPTEAQRYYTNVSYAGQEAAFNFFIVTGSTELKDGKPFAYMLTYDNDTFLIAGGYGTDKDSSLSFDAVPKTAIDSEALEQAIAIVESLKIY